MWKGRCLRTRGPGGGGLGEAEAAGVAAKPSVTEKALRMRRTVAKLADARTVGNRQAMPKWRMLQRVLAKYNHERRSARRRKSRWGFGVSAGPEEDWLEERGKYYEGGEFRQRLRRSLEGYFEVQSSDNAAFHKTAAIGSGAGSTTSMLSVVLHGGCGSERVGWHQGRAIGGAPVRHNIGMCRVITLFPFFVTVH